MYIVSNIKLDPLESGGIRIEPSGEIWVEDDKRLIQLSLYLAILYTNREKEKIILTKY